MCYLTGEAEAQVTDLNFPRLSIFRPALLLCERQESRVMEKVAQVRYCYYYYHYYYYCYNHHHYHYERSFERMKERNTAKISWTEYFPNLMNIIVYIILLRIMHTFFTQKMLKYYLCVVYAKHNH